MSNLGLEIFLKNKKINFKRSKVGDRYVKEKMKKFNYNLGGEQSGHIILGKFATTGDGLLVALEVLFSLRKGRKASETLNVFKPFPQKLENIIVKNKDIINHKICIKAVKKANSLMKNKGRILVRKSGTEPKIRIMAESNNKNLIKKCISIVKKALKKLKPKTKILIIAGSDSSGGAGIQADIKTVTSLGGYAMTALTAITAQNTTGVLSISSVSANDVSRQILFTCKDIRPDAIKIGMLHSIPIIDNVAKSLRKIKLKKIILDPVMVAKGGHKLITSKAVRRLKKKLFGLVTLITPNIPEAEVLSSSKINTIDDMILAARRIKNLGVDNVLIKGGHLQSNEMYDILLSKNKIKIFKNRKIKSLNTHGTGCTLSSAISTYIGCGKTIEKSCELGIKYVNQAIRSKINYGKGRGPINHLVSISLRKDY